MAQRPRAFLREIGGRLWALLDEVGSRNTLSAAIVLAALSFLALSLSLVYLGVTRSRQQAVEQIGEAQEDAPPPAVQPEDLPLIFGPGTSAGATEATPPTGVGWGYRGSRAWT